MEKGGGGRYLLLLQHAQSFPFQALSQHFSPSCLRYDTPATTSKKKVRIKDRNKLSTEERRKLFEQEVAQREAQKQQQQLQSLGMASPLPYDSMGYSAAHHAFMGYPPGYPMQSYVDPTNPNAGKVLLPTPSLDPMCSPAAFEHTQTLVGHTIDSTLTAPQPVPVVQHVATALEVSTPQYATPSDPAVHQEQNITVLPVPTPGPVQGQSYGVWDSSQQTVAVQPPYSPAQAQPTIYYPGQACQTVYGVTSPYSQTTTPIVQVTLFQQSWKWVRKKFWIFGKLKCSMLGVQCPMPNLEHCFQCDLIWDPVVNAQSATWDSVTRAKLWWSLA